MRGYADYEEHGKNFEFFRYQIANIHFQYDRLQERKKYQKRAAKEAVSSGESQVLV